MLRSKNFCHAVSGRPFWSMSSYFSIIWARVTRSISACSSMSSSGASATSVSTLERTAFTVAFRPERAASWLCLPLSSLTSTS